MDAGFPHFRTFRTCNCRDRRTGSDEGPTAARFGGVAAMYPQIRKTYPRIYPRAVPDGGTLSRTPADAKSLIFLEARGLRRTLADASE